MIISMKWALPYSFLVLFASGPLVSTISAQQATDAELNQGPKAEAVGDRVMVSTQHPTITKAAIQVLRDGGNAMDALITSVFMQHVHQYHHNYLFGTTSGIYYEAATGEYHVFNGFSDRPLADRCEHGDASQVAIGGTVRTMEALAERFGTWDWTSYLAPAIASAEEGVFVTSFMYGENFLRLEAGDLTADSAQRAFYMRDGHLVPVGERWKMPELALTLRKIAEDGADYMYTGDWGRRFVEEANDRGYCVTLDDMAEYETRWLEPVRFTYRGQEILMEPPPVSGGLQVGYMLNILENFDLQALGHYTESPETLELMARAFGRASSETGAAIRDPLSFENPGDLWFDKEYGRMGGEFVRNTMRRPDVSLSQNRGDGWTPGDQLEGSRDRVPSIGSQHNVIVDAEGNWVTMLHTSHGGAPGIFIDGVRAGGSGMRGETRGPGRRIIAPVAATMLIRDGRPWMALGTPGNPPQPVAEVLINLLEFDMAPKDAVEAPRFWAFRRPSDPSIEIESRISSKVRQGMRDAGIDVVDLGPFYWSAGSVQIIWRDREGKLHGVTDPRRLGHALGF